EYHVSEDAVRTAAVNLVPSRSILCVIRSGILAHSFPVALATRNLTFNQDINAIVIRDERVLPEYLFHLLKGLEKEGVKSGAKKGKSLSRYALFRCPRNSPPPAGRAGADCGGAGGLSKDHRGRSPDHR